MIYASNEWLRVYFTIYSVMLKMISIGELLNDWAIFGFIGVNFFKVTIAPCSPDKTFRILNSVLTMK